MDHKEKYINPFTDFGFKKLFGSEFNKELLIDFLNQVLGDRERIQDLTYLNTENLGKTESDRNAIFDLYCQNESGEKFIIELQNVKQEYFKDRSIFYSTFAIQSQALKGRDWDYSLKAVYTIGILNFSFADKSGRERYQREVRLLDTETNEVFYDKLTFIYLEMPKFDKRETELVSQFDKWMYVLKNLNRLKDRPIKLQEKVFEKLFSEAEIAKLKPEDMRTYEESLKVYRDNYSTMKYAKDEAKREGREEGLEEGREQGLEEGKKKGLEEGKKKSAIYIARQMKKDGQSVESISKYTGLKSDEIEEL